MAKIVLIDSFGFIFRAYHALPYLGTSSGLSTNAVYGFVRMALGLLEDMDAEYIAAVYDSPVAGVRKKLYKDYKANRQEPHHDLVQQIPLVKEALEALNIVTVESEGYEADDVIAAYTKLAKEQGLEVVIISSDKDLMQLIDSENNVSMYDSVKKRFIKETEVLAKFGVSPKEVAYVQALIGDSSDNIPGVKGIGAVTAGKLISDYSTLDNLYNNLEEIKSASVRRKLEEGKDSAYLSLHLATLDAHAPLPQKLESLRVRPLNPHQLYAFCEALEFKQLSKMLQEKYSITADSALQATQDGAIKSTDLALDEGEESLEQPGIKYKYEVITTVSALADLKDTLQLTSEIMVAFNASNLVIATSDNNVIYSLIIGDGYGLQSMLGGSIKPYSSVTKKDIAEQLGPIFSHDAIKKVFIDSKKFMHYLREKEIATLSAFDDIGVMAYTLYGPRVVENKEALMTSQLGSDKCSALLHDIESELPPDEALCSCICDALAIKKIYLKLKNELIRQGVKSVYEQINKPIIEVLYHMETRGIHVDETTLQQLSKTVVSQLKEAEKQIFSIVGYEFNVSSPKQVGEALFTKLGIKGKKNKTGSWKTDASYLEELAADGVAIAKLLLEWRSLNKLQTTYLNALPSYISPQDGRIHTTYVQTSTATGRLSSNDPNLQNIPIKTPLGKQIREAFIASRGFSLVSLDFSQIELRLLAHIGNVTPLIEAFKNRADIHLSTAQEVFGLSAEEVDAEYRRKAKAINFGIIYGVSEFGLAKNLQIDRELAKAYIDYYFARYPEIQAYMKAAKAEARENGYVVTLKGKKCFIPLINSSNGAVRAFAERAAINAKLQGSAADLMNICMHACFTRIQQCYKDCAFLLLQIHDELVFEVESGIAEEFAKEMAQIMRSVVDLKVPIEVNYSIGKTWSDIH